MNDELPERMTAGELQMVREYLGLTMNTLAQMLQVRQDTIGRWELGKEPIPYRVREQVEQIEDYTAQCVDEVIAALQDARDPAVIVYRTDDDLATARPDVGHMGARWWRRVVARACEDVPGVWVGTRADLPASTDPGSASA